MQLYLIRHPPPAVAVGICYGATDLALATDPQAGAAVIHAQLPASLPLFSSPLRRCLDLAQCLPMQPVIIDPRLAEMNFGAWEMCAWTDIGPAALEAWAADPLHYTPPGGESVRALQRRVLHFLTELASQRHDAAALVTHAGVMKVISGHMQNLPPPAWMQLRFAYGSVVQVTL